MPDTKRVKKIMRLTGMSIVIGNALFIDRLIILDHRASRKRLGLVKLQWERSIICKFTNGFSIKSIVVSYLLKCNPNEKHEVTLISEQLTEIVLQGKFLTTKVRRAYIVLGVDQFPCEKGKQINAAFGMRNTPQRNYIRVLMERNMR